MNVVSEPACLPPASFAFEILIWMQNPEVAFVEPDRKLISSQMGAISFRGRSGKRFETGEAALVGPC